MTDEVVAAVAGMASNSFIVVGLAGDRFGAWRVTEESGARDVVHFSAVLGAGATVHVARGASDETKRHSQGVSGTSGEIDFQVSGSPPGYALTLLAKNQRHYFSCFDSDPWAV